jgi:hypothetical protein
MKEGEDYLKYGRAIEYWVEPDYINLDNLKKEKARTMRTSSFRF